MMDKKGRKTMFIIGIVVFLVVVASVAVYVTRLYKFNVSRQDVVKIDIEYWGEDYSKMLVDSNDLDILVSTLNSLSLRKRMNPNVDVKSGALAITLYNSNEEEIDYFFVVVNEFDYSKSWVYRGSHPYGNKNRTIGYYSGNQLSRLYDVCNVIAPFRGD